jgi:uncharacterized delta-60 repeat protein
MPANPTLLLAALFTAASIPALAHDGDLVDGFGSGGLARMGYTNASTNVGSSPLVGVDGSVTYCTTRGTAGHGDMVVARVHPDGSPDFSFSTDGRLTIDIGADTDDECTAITATADGKIVIAGDSYDGNVESFALVRIKANGALDTTFGIGGKQLIGFDVFGATASNATAVATLPDGKIIVSGHANTNEGHQFLLARLLSDGSYDTAFNLIGRQRVAIGGSARSYAMAIDAQGRIVLAGYTSTGGSDANYDMAVARLLPDGSLDPSFDGDGRATVAFDIGGEGTHNLDMANALALQPDGKIVLAGTVDVSATATENIDFGIARLSANGALDSSFGSGGRVLVPFDRSPGGSDTLLGVRVDAGRIVAAGYAIQGTTSIDVALVRLRADGSRDPTFGNLGRKTLDFGFPGTGQLAFGLGGVGNRLYITGVVATSATSVDAYVAAVENDVLFADGFD